MAQHVKVERTVVSMRDYARAVIKGWKLLEGDYPSKKTVAVLYAQYMIETGGRACWNWNIGNAKHVSGDGFDWVALSGVWEGVDPFVAAALIARGDAVIDTNEVHKKAVGSKKTAVIFKTGVPGSLFRAYPSLDAAMVGHMHLLKGRFGRCWPDVINGDYRGFAHSLKAGPDGKEGTWDDYFTAEAEAYAAGMAPHYMNFNNSSMFDSELQAVLTEAAPTLEQLPEDDSPTTEVEVPEMRPDPMGHVAVVHPKVPLRGDICTRCGRVVEGAFEDCPAGKEIEDGGTEPHTFD